MVMPGDTVDLTVELGKPVAMDAGSASPSARAAAPSRAGTVTALLD